MNFLNNGEKKEFLDNLERVGEMVPVMDMDDRDFTAAVLYRMARIVREHGPSHGVSVNSVLVDELSLSYGERPRFKIGDFEFRNTRSGTILKGWTDSADPLPEHRLEDLIPRVIYAPPATIIVWKDGTKTVVKCSDEDLDAGRISPEYGIVYAIVKKILGNKGNYNNVLKRLVNRAVKY